MDMMPPHLPDLPIADLVSSFMEAAELMVASTQRDASISLSAELTYELDQVVSQFLEDHALSSSDYDSIQQCVLGRLSSELSTDPFSTGDDHVFSPEDSYHSSLADVMSLVDHHLSQPAVVVTWSDSFDMESPGAQC